MRIAILLVILTLLSLGLWLPPSLTQSPWAEEYSPIDQKNILNPISSLLDIPSVTITGTGLKWIVLQPSSRLSIPSIHVNVTLVPVGLTTGGALDVPKNFTYAGWYRLGAHPGEIGTAVIDGHFGYLKGKPAVFNNLHRLRAWDRLSVMDAKGESTFFTVRETRTYQLNEEAPEVFYSNDGKAHLNIITCQGTWSQVSKMYLDRLVVFTDREE